MKKLFEDYITRLKVDTKKNKKQQSFVLRQFEELIKKNLQVPIKLYHL